MLGVSSYTARPSITKVIRDVLTSAIPGSPSMGDLPGEEDGYPDSFIVVERKGGTEIAQGYLAESLLVIQCYALNGPDAETLAEQVVAALKSAQFTRVGETNLRKLNLVSLPQKYDDPRVVQRRRYQLAATFITN